MKIPVLAVSPVLLAVGTVLLVQSPILADPVPDGLVHEFWDLVEVTADEGRCPDSNRLIDLFGTHGIGILEVSHRKKIVGEFEAFAPILAASQRPPYVPDLRLQTLYRGAAGEDQRAEMLTALREWLTADINEAPRKGTERLDGSIEELDPFIDYARSVAAEMLADWQDQDAATLMVTLEQKGDLTEEAAWRVRRARERLTNPCAMSFLRAKPGGDVECCQGLRSLQHVTAGTGGWQYHKELYRLSPEEMGDVWALMEENHIGENSKWAGNVYVFAFEFADGVKASISPTEAGRLVYRDNTMLQGAGWLTLENEELYELVWEIFERELGVHPN